MEQDFLFYNIFNIIMYLTAFGFMFYISRFFITPFAMYLHGGKYYFYKTKFNKETLTELPLTKRYTTKNSIDGYAILYEKKIIRKFIVPEDLNKTDINNPDIIVDRLDVEAMELILDKKVKVGKLIMDTIKFIIFTILNSSLAKIILEKHNKIKDLNPWLLALFFIFISCYLIMRVIIISEEYDMYELKILLLLSSLKKNC